MAGYTFQKVLQEWRNPAINYGAEDLSDLTTNDIDVNTTLKPIDRKYASLEAEMGEYAFLQDGNLFKVLGNKHSKGKNSGTPLNLPEGSFIYSNYKPLAISKDDKELFQFKKGGKTKSDNTPAKILSREINTKHHNKMVAMLDSNVHDDISKNSAKLMLEKNVKKLGQIAFLQEERKGFPDGLPPFSEGTAPIKDVQNDIMQQQYKQGGFVSLKKYHPGGPISDDIKKRAKRVGTVDDNYNEIGREGNDIYYVDPNGNTVYLPNASGGKRTNSDVNYINQLASDPRYNTQSWDDLATKGYVSKNNSLRNSWTPLSTTNPDYVYRRTDAGEITPIPRGFNPPITPPGIINPPLTRTPSLDIGIPPPGDVNDPILPYEPDVPFSPWQKLNMGYAAYNASSINRYDPKRAQLNFTPLSLNRINSQPYLNAVDNQTSQAYQTNQGLNPILARANNSQIYGRGLQEKSQVLGNIENQNLQIDNQEATYNNQGINNTANKNVELDQTYYDQVQRTNQNFDNEKRMGRNQFVSLANSYKSQNDALELQLASQQTFGSVWEDPNTGRKYPGITDEAARKLNLVKRASPLYDYNNRTNKVFYTGAGINLDALPTGTQGATQTVEQYLQYLEQIGANPEATARAFGYAYPKLINPRK